MLNFFERIIDKFTNHDKVAPLEKYDLSKYESFYTDFVLKKIYTSKPPHEAISLSQYDFINLAFRSKGIKYKCPLCGGVNFGVNKDINIQYMNSVSFRSFENVCKQPSLMVYHVVCNNCGNVHQIMLRELLDYFGHDMMYLFESYFNMCKEFSYTFQATNGFVDYKTSFQRDCVDSLIHAYETYTDLFKKIKNQYESNKKYL